MSIRPFMRSFWHSSLMIFIFILLNIKFVAAANSPETNLTLKPGILIVGTFFNNPPFAFLENNHQVGFEVDLIKELAKRLNLTVEFKSTQWETIFTELKENQYDVIMSTITITPEREKIFLFSKPYITTSLSIIINKKRNKQIKSIEDLRNFIIGVQAATTNYDVALKMKKMNQIQGIKIYSYNDFVMGINDLVAGNIGAIMKIFPVAFYYTNRYPELKILELPHDPQPLGFGFNKNNKKLMDEINKIQSEMKRDGSYNKIYQRWFGSY